MMVGRRTAAPGGNPPQNPFTAPNVVGSEASAAAMAAANGEPPAAVPVTGDKIVALQKPIRTHQGEVRAITLRDPIAQDYIEIEQLPFEVRGTGDERRITVNFKIAAKWVARMANLDELLVGQLSAGDWQAVVAATNEKLIAAAIDNMGN